MSSRSTLVTPWIAAQAFGGFLALIIGGKQSLLVPSLLHSAGAEFLALTSHVSLFFTEVETIKQREAPEII